MIKDKERILKNQSHLLLQEIDDPWKMLVCCIMLNQTNRKQVDKIRLEFFDRYNDPMAAVKADTNEISEILKPLGFKNRRTNAIIRFSKEWLEKSWSDPIELYGIGQYAKDSYDIFINGKRDITPNDKVLKKYMGC